MSGYDETLLSRILGMNRGDLYEYIIREMEIRHLSDIDYQYLLESHRKSDYYNFIVKHLHPEFAPVLLGKNNGFIMLGMFSDDEKAA